MIHDTTQHLCPSPFQPIVTLGTLIVCKGSNRDNRLPENKPFQLETCPLGFGTLYLPGLTKCCEECCKGSCSVSEAQLSHDLRGSENEVGGAGGGASGRE